MEKTTRRIIKLGGNLVVTLPKGYTDYYNIKPKDLAEVITSDKGIFIRPLKRQKRAVDPFFHGGGG